MIQMLPEVIGKTIVTASSPDERYLTACIKTLVEAGIVYPLVKEMELGIGYVVPIILLNGALAILLELFLKLLLELLFFI
ncbi:hypothetical protein [Paenibacillus graminis]|uniref:hypothetical protein n=1 Tax=Paenibacillus graminis TaxID=189425 RepID=UPI002DB65AB7|nr:hypothetical protein [Paenibacillus graminis]MEC0168070.1 hypothetical protein [Paenibacillus graminis]